MAGLMVIKNFVYLIVFYLLIFVCLLFSLFILYLFSYVHNQF